MPIHELKYKLKFVVISILLTVVFLILGIPAMIVMFIGELISEALIRLSFKFLSLKERNLKESDLLEEEIKRSYEEYLPTYAKLGRSDLTSANQSGDQIVQKLSYGYYKLNNDAFDEFLEVVRISRSSFSNIVSRISLIPKICFYMSCQVLQEAGLRRYINFLPFDDAYEFNAACVAQVKSIFKFQGCVLSSIIMGKVSISGIEEEIATSLRTILSDGKIVPFTKESRCLDFFMACENMRVRTCDRADPKEINKKIAENVAGIFGLLVSVELGEEDAQLSDKEFEQRFNAYVYNLMICVGCQARKCGIERTRDRTTQPKLEDQDVQDLRREFSNFLNNFLKHDVLISLTLEQKKNYINMCCIKMLRCYIEEDRKPGEYSTPFPIDYRDRANRIATYLSDDIVKGLSTIELYNLYMMCGSNPLSNVLLQTNLCSEDPRFSDIVCELLSRESMMGQLGRPMRSIENIIRSHIGKDIPEFSHEVSCSETSASPPELIEPSVPSLSLGARAMALLGNHLRFIVGTINSYIREENTPTHLHEMSSESPSILISIASSSQEDATKHSVQVRK